MLLKGRVKTQICSTVANLLTSPYYKTFNRTPPRKWGVSFVLLLQYIFGSVVFLLGNQPFPFAKNRDVGKLSALNDTSDGC